MLVSPRNKCVTHLGNVGCDFGVAIFFSNSLLSALRQRSEQLAKFVAALGVAGCEQMKELEVELDRKGRANDTRRHRRIVNAGGDGNTCEAARGSVEKTDGLIQQPLIHWYGSDLLEMDGVVHDVA